jgi:hypothetical protein
MIAAAVAAAAALASPAARAESVDLEVVHRIKQEAFKGSKVMDHLHYLTDVNGPRLTGSPGYRKAAEWVVRSAKGWGLENAALEKWGRFGRGWSLERFSAHLIEPAYEPLAGVPLAWSAATKGPVSGELVLAPLFTAMELRREEDEDPPRLAARIREYSERHKGKLRGKIVLIHPLRDLPPPEQPASERLNERGLGELAEAPEPYAPPPLEWPVTQLPEDPKKRRRFLDSLPILVENDYYELLSKIRGRLNAFLRDEGALAVLASDFRGDGGIIFAEEAGSWLPGEPVPPPVVKLRPEDFQRLARLVERGAPVKLELDVRSRFHDDDLDGFNVVAEIPGGKKKEEVVMLGGHLDSWHGGTGATDNAAGCAVMLEAMRILKTLALPMDRTVRLALWDGEEQGYYGSAGYVRRHFGDPVTMKLLPGHATLAGYFNVDNGTGKIRGVYLQGNDMARPIFEAWLRPFHDLGATTLSIQDTRGTDHLLFDAVGLPGFQFIQDPVDYESRTHHSNVDVYDHVVPADLMQASAVVASFVYNAATRAEMLPRKPLPKPLPPKKDVDL